MATVISSIHSNKRAVFRVPLIFAVYLVGGTELQPESGEAKTSSTMPQNEKRNIGDPKTVFCSVAVFLLGGILIKM